MTIDFSGKLLKGVAPHNVNQAELDALGMEPTDLGRVWFPTVPNNIELDWMGAMTGPAQLQYLRDVPLGATLIFGNEFNLFYEPKHESAEMSPVDAAAMFVMARWMRPDLLWWGPAVNGIDAWGVDALGRNVDGLPYPWFRAFIKSVFEQWLPVKERFGLPGPFENLVGYMVNWYTHTVDIPDAWRLPSYAANMIVEAADTAGLKRPRPVRIGEFSVRQKPAMLVNWIEDMRASRWIEAAYIFTPFDPKKPHFSLLNADMSRKTTGEIWHEFRGD